MVEFFPAFAAVAAASSTPAADYPLREVLTVFATACGEVENPAATNAVLKATGWRRLKKGSDTPVSRLIERSGGGVDSITVYGNQFKLELGGRMLYLLLSDTSYGGSMTGNIHDCQVFDFSATKAPDVSEINRWADREPESDETETDGSRVIRYSGLKAGQMGFSVLFAPISSATSNGFSGLALSASSYYQRARGND